MRKYTIKSALADYFQGTIGESKLRELLRAGEILHIRVGTKIIIKEEALDKYMEDQEKKSILRSTKKLKAVK